MARIDANVLSVLERTIYVEGEPTWVRFPELDRDSYTAAMDVLKKAGGKWDGKKAVRAVVFPIDARAVIEALLATEDTNAANQDAFFATPTALGKQCVRLLKSVTKRQQFNRILEPSAGVGDLLNVLDDLQPQHVTAVEVNKDRIGRLDAMLSRLGLATGAETELWHGDFLNWGATTPFDLVLMNPPFTLVGAPNVFLKHILRAWELVAPGGALCSIVPNSLFFRNTGLFPTVRKLVDEYGFQQDNPDDAFKASGTLIRTATIILMRTEDSAPLLPSNNGVTIYSRRDGKHVAPTGGQEGDVAKLRMVRKGEEFAPAVVNEAPAVQDNTQGWRLLHRAVLGSAMAWVAYAPNGLHYVLRSVEEAAARVEFADMLAKKGGVAQQQESAMHALLA